MCNAWNHPPGCSCGWGGDGHSGRSSGGWRGGNRYHHALSYYSIDANSYRWHYYQDDFCRPTRCPICGAEVFFVRHNGGSVWFESLGKPWPKHGCFDNGRSSNRYYYHSSQYGWNSTWGIHNRLLSFMNSLRSPLIGVIVEVKLRPQKKEYLLIIRCSDDTMIKAYIPKKGRPQELIGEIVLLSKVDLRFICVSIAWWYSYQEKPTPPETQYLVGEYYSHTIFGVGKLLEIRVLPNDYRLVVDFPELGIKHLMASFAKLSHLKSYSPENTQSSA